MSARANGSAMVGSSSAKRTLVMGTCCHSGTPPWPLLSRGFLRTGPAGAHGSPVGRPAAILANYRQLGRSQYYLMYSEPVTTDAVIEKAAANDFTVLRAWAFFDIGQTDGTGTIADGDKGVYFHYWDPQAGAPAFNDGANGLEKLDYMVAKAAEEGVRLVLPLTNNWANFGGIDQYNAWAGAQYHSDFYTDPTMRQWYKDWISHLLNRVNTITGVAYKDDPTIMAWELANEPRCGGSGLFPRDPGCNSDMLTAWVDEMSTYIKSIDDNHLVGTGDEGFLCDQPAGHWTRNCADGVDAVGAVAGPVAGGLVAQEAFVTGPHQVVVVNRLDVCRHLVHPRSEHVRVAAGIPREQARAAAARFVGELPGHDRRVVLVRDAGDGVDPVEQVGDPVLVPLAHRRVGVEVAVVLGAGPGVVLVDPAEVGPVVGQRQDQANAFLAGLGHHVVQLL